MTFFAEKKIDFSTVSRIEHASASKTSTTEQASSRFEELMKSKSSDNKTKKKSTQEAKGSGTSSVFDLAKDQTNSEFTLETKIESFSCENSKIAMAQLAEQICERIDLMQSVGKTDVSFELRYPPIFEGAQVTITEYDQAQKEYNLQFSNLQVLSIDGRNLLERRLSELRQQLDAKGVTVHQITTDLKEIKAFAAQPQHQHGQQQGQQKGQGQQKEQHKKQQEQDVVAFVLE